MEKSTKVITGKVRFCYEHVFEPDAMDGGKPKYSVCIVIDKQDKVTLKKIEDAVNTAMQLGMDKIGKNGKIAPGLKMPLRDGDEERPDDSTFEGCMFVNASSNMKPGVVDAELNPLMSRDEFYSGCYGRASINFYAFNSNGNRGIACGLNNLQKLEDGERLAGAASAEDDFGDEMM